PGMLFGKILRSPYAHAKVVKIDTSEAEKMPGFKGFKLIDIPGGELQWAGQEILALAAETEQQAEDALRAIKVTYEKLPHFVNEFDRSKAPAANLRNPGGADTGKVDAAMAGADVVVHEGLYGNDVITHCCLEAHGMVTEWRDDKNVFFQPSTQAVSGIGGDLARALEIPASNVHLHMDHVGGGFGSKFPVELWSIEFTKLSKQIGGKPIKYFLDRDHELAVAGTRPSTYAKVKVAAKKDGTLVAWDSDAWGSGGIGNVGSPPFPYVWKLPEQRTKFQAVATNVGPQRAWRAPNHPQAALITMGALEDLAAKLQMDPLDFFLKNIEMTGVRANVYKEELMKAAELIGWKANWRQRGTGGVGSSKTVKRGFGLSLHTWGGQPHPSDCDVIINPDGSVEVRIGTQDLGVGTRTALNIVAAESLGLPLNAIKVTIGDNKLPPSGASGGSTTIGGISSSTRRGSIDALNLLFEKVAGDLGTTADKLEAVGSKIQVIGDATKSMPWKQACTKLGVTPITARGKNPGKETLATAGVGGVQMADVSVDIETGIVKMNKFVAVQDCGLIIDLKTAESQVFGAMIMGVTYALYEEKIMDDATGKMLNGNMEFYKLAGLRDIGEFQVHMMTGKGYDERGVIGLGEPPTNSPGAAISNAVANAIGVRVPTIPLTPARVLEALAKGGKS
ncbi:MAG: xanthine dehydrogenase family protein molybdopterin-binding subunit, partial [Acidobacteria bacterium]|nr:xanthine dehydrogenase family protein molybdopterin-binding subunit [Acidobacteriota bacterium]